MANVKTFLGEHKTTILYSASLGLLLFLLKWAELRLLVFEHSFEIYIGLIAIIFTALGIWLALKLAKPRVQTVIVEKEVFVPLPENFTINEPELKKLNLSNREYEILKLLALGHSNEEIAKTLFVSLSTVKTHNQNLFAKMEVKRRIQAVEKAKRLKIIP
ncbi:MAG: hypothetical protein JNM68_12955 [Dinghuibacter sp.]|nr:hypothetical protein [Dinghuibacter sp.]